MKFTPPIRGKQKRAAEDGYVLLGVLIMLAIFVIMMGLAAPKIAQEIQRDREVETMRRGKQYIRAVQLYYRKFQAYPPNIDALVKTNDIRFLRKRYKDPLTGKDDWKPIMYCQNKAPIAMGFFGQPLAMATGCGVLAGTGPGGTNGVQGNGIFGGQGSASGSPIGGSPIGGSTIGGSSIGGSSIGGSLFNNSGGANPTLPTPTAPVTTTPTDPNNPQQSSSSQPSATGVPGSPGGTDTSTNANGGFSLGDNGQTFGGGGIIGFSPAPDRKSILVYKKKDHYNQWEFTYSPIMDQQTMTGGNTGAVGQPMGSQGTGITNPTSPTSPTSPTGPGFGPNNNGGPAPIGSPPATPPEQ